LISPPGAAPNAGYLAGSSILLQSKPLSASRLRIKLILINQGLLPSQVFGRSKIVVVLNTIVTFS